LPVVRLPLRVAFANDDRIADGFDAQSGQGNARRHLRAQPPQRAQDARRRQFRFHERLRGTKHHQVLEREPVFAARPARRRHESRIDQSANDGARESEQPADVAQ